VTEQRFDSRKVKQDELGSIYRETGGEVSLDQ